MVTFLAMRYITTVWLSSTPLFSNSSYEGFQNVFFSNQIQNGFSKSSLVSHPLEFCIIGSNSKQYSPLLQQHTFNFSTCLPLVSFYDFDVSLKSQEVIMDKAQFCLFLFFSALTRSLIHFNGFKVCHDKLVLLNIYSSFFNSPMDSKLL